MVKECRVWHSIIAFRQQTQSNDIERGMTSPPFDSTHGQTMSGVACHHRLWTSSHSRTAWGVAFHHHPLTENAFERCWAWHAIIALGQHKRSNDVSCGMPSSPLGCTHGRTTSGVACHHRLWAAHTVERRRARHAIRALGQHTRSNDVGCGIPSWTLDNTQGRTTSGKACHHSP